MWKQLRHMNEDSEVVNYLKQKTFSPLEKALCRKKKKIKMLKKTKLQRQIQCCYYFQDLSKILEASIEQRRLL